MISRLGAPVALHIETIPASTGAKASATHPSDKIAHSSLEERVRHRMKNWNMSISSIKSKRAEKNQFNTLIESEHFWPEKIGAIFDSAPIATHIDLCCQLVDSACDAISAAPESGGNILRTTMETLLKKDEALAGEQYFFNSLIARLDKLAKYNNILYDDIDSEQSTISNLSSSASSGSSAIIQHLQACVFNPDNKIPSDFYIVNFLTSNGEELRIIGRRHEDEFHATNPDNGEVLAKLKRIAVYTSDQSAENGEKASIVWIEPQNTGIKGGAQNYSALYHETPSENLSGINYQGIYPRSQTGAEGIGLMDDEDGSYLYAYHLQQDPGMGEPVPIFATNVREWQDDPWSAGKRTTIPTIPARNYQGGKAAISVTAPLTPRTVRGMDYFYSQATGQNEPAGQGAQSLLNEFHRKFPGTGFPKNIS